MSNPTPLDAALFSALFAEAAQRPRKRANHNLHLSLDAPCQRFLNAVACDSYVRPHRHFGVGKEETLLVLQGRIGLLGFNDAGAVTSVLILMPAGPVPGAHIQCGDWHALVALEPSLIFEAKGGPYDPAQAAEMAPWAPAEGTVEASAYLAWMRSRCEA